MLPDVPGGTGKGNALWMSLYACEGDIVCWLDADVRNFGSHFVTRLLEPLLTDPKLRRTGQKLGGLRQAPLEALLTGFCGPIVLGILRRIDGRIDSTRSRVGLARGPRTAAGDGMTLR